ncbi:autotransporter domain-containing protein [Bosea sp. TAF32]|uniref:autotransporter domain-containing protein n=1 Tax=Bosea sp. TAF32 TaxID=3237482 RepID=UPI003F8F7484
MIAGYRLTSLAGLDLSPEAGVSLNYFQQHSLTETQAGAFALTLRGQNQTSARSLVGARLSTPLAAIVLTTGADRPFSGVEDALSVVGWRPVGLRFTNDLAIGWNARSYSRLNTTVTIARYAERYHLRVFIPIIAVPAVSLFVLWTPGFNEQDKGGLIFSSLLALAAISFTFESSFPGSVSLNTPVAEMISLGYLYLVVVLMFEIVLSVAIAHPGSRWRGHAADLRWHLRWAVPAMMLIICVGAAVRALPG